MHSYTRQTLETPNPIARFAHRRRYATSLSFTAEEAASGATVLDYGCGEGHFLDMLANRRPDLNLVGYDPFSLHEGKSYRKVDTVTAVEPGTVDVLTCFETLEHLDDTETTQFLDEAASLLSPRGKLVVSVPIIGGPVLLLKLANHTFLGRRLPDYTAKELFGAVVLGRPAARPTDVKTTHKGWDFRTVAPRAARDEFVERRRLLSPFSRLPWWLNSQAFYVFSRAAGQPPTN